MGNQLDAVFICIALCNSEIAGKSTNSFSYKKKMFTCLFIHANFHIPQYLYIFYASLGTLVFSVVNTHLSCFIRIQQLCV